MRVARAGEHKAGQQELENLLDRIELSTTHYEALGLACSAAREEIKLAYQQAVTLLHPSGHKSGLTIPHERIARIDRAFDRVSLAFSVLTNVDMRAEYDLYCATVNAGPAPSGAAGDLHP